MNPFKMGAPMVRRTVVMAAVLAAAASARAQTAMAPFTLSVFPGTPPTGATKPDDLAVSANGKHLWVDMGTVWTQPARAVQAPSSSTTSHLGRF